MKIGGGRWHALLLASLCLPPLACAESDQPAVSATPWELMEIGRIGTVDGEGTSLTSINSVVRRDSIIFAPASASRPAMSA